MRWILLCLALVCSSVSAAEVVTVTVTTAQQDAETMARTGQLRHCGRAGGVREGIGFSSVSADAALRNCCFFGRYKIREKAVVRGAKGYYAVIRYE